MNPIRDRGNIKWSTMMLPEHRQLLQELELAQDEQECPDLSEDQQEELELVIGESMAEAVEVMLTFFAEKRYSNFTGIIKKYDPLNRTICVENKAEIRKTIPISAVIKAARVG